MIKRIALIWCLLTPFFNGAQGFQLPQIPSKSPRFAKSSVRTFATPVTKTDEEWKAQLSADAYNVLRKEGTEGPWTSSLNEVKDDGTFYCKGCGEPLFRTATKFESGSGWPSFYSPIDQDAIILSTDFKLVLPRTECQCASCNGHLGHVFEDGPEPTGQRYCLNGVAMKFRADEFEEEDILNGVLEREANASKVKSPVLSVLPSSIFYGGVSLLYFNAFVTRLQFAQDSGASFPSGVLDLFPIGIGGFCLYLSIKGFAKLL
mmetsp:Transcript_3151/g.6963  ORF Transcript_3151/g.6963 Transcript_3151/m.6963 type:complete len:261 (+) Transcript_3151:126-908(+)|eukprot:CAMPEP_0172313348 /NCGR_PEP_ID=MMETSP1058-20130122/20103_1 /TAXON_ID=83371 /ORGANISM="Detonula confervacea, Strain CCMP 353" /LENGTH=260 /DNA_ID=CAMNT_0013026991 /DNA_START=88 /DNA_END=870 /DNA_ORIENTATION=+